MQTQMKTMCLLLVCCKMQLVTQYVACSPFLGDNTRFLVSVRGVSNLPASHGCSFCRSSNSLLGSVLVRFLRARRWLVGACAFHIQRAKRTFANEHKVSIPTYFRFTSCRNCPPHVSQYGLAYTVYRAVPGPAHHYLQGCHQGQSW